MSIAYDGTVGSVAEDALPPALAPTDEELLARTRSGDRSAYAELWQRHVQAALTFARQLTHRVDPEDLVAEAYTQVLAAMARGNGPESSFRSYLFASMRNISQNCARGGRLQPTDTLDEVVEREAQGPQDFEDHTLDRLVLRRAFQSLPMRMRELLWVIEVEGLKAHEVSDELKLTPNTVAVHTYRAKERLKQAWITEHLNTRGLGSDCIGLATLFGMYVRGKTSAAQRHRIERHREDCLDCARMLQQATSVAAQLHSALVPVALIGAGSVSLAAFTTVAGAQSASAAGAASASAATQSAMLAQSTGAASKAPLAVFTKLGGAVLAATMTTAIIAVAVLNQAQPAPASSDIATIAQPTPGEVGVAGEASAASTIDGAVAAGAPVPDGGRPASAQQRAELRIALEAGVPLAAPTFAFADGQVFRDARQVLSGGGTPGAAVTAIVSGLHGYRTLTSEVSADGTWAVRPADGEEAFEDGDFTVRAFQTVDSFPRSDVQSAQFAVAAGLDIPAPVVGAVDSGGGLFEPVLRGSALPNALVMLFANGVPTVVQANAAGMWQATVTDGLAPGLNTLVLYQQQENAPLSLPSEPVAVPLLAPVPDLRAQSAQTITLSVAAQPGATFSITDAVGSFTHRVAGADRENLLQLDTISSGAAPGGAELRCRYVSADGLRVGVAASLSVPAAA